MRKILETLYARAVAVLPPSAFLPPAEPEKLRGHDMVAFRYAFDRASLEDGIPAFALTYERLLKYPLRTVERAFSVIAVPLIPFFLLFFRRDAAHRRVAGPLRHAAAVRDRRPAGVVQHRDLFAVLIDGSIPRRPKWPEKLLEAGFALTPEIVVKEERAVPGWFRALAGAPKSDAYLYRFIPPRKPGSAE